MTFCSAPNGTSWEILPVSALDFKTKFLRVLYVLLLEEEKL
jgi:hypothetical protein